VGREQLYDDLLQGDLLDDGRNDDVPAGHARPKPERRQGRPPEGRQPLDAGRPEGRPPLWRRPRGRRPRRRRSPRPGTGDRRLRGH